MTDVSDRLCRSNNQHRIPATVKQYTHLTINLQLKLWMRLINVFKNFR